MGRLRKGLIFLRDKTVPLRPTLVSSIIVIVVLTVIGVAIPAYLSSKKSIDYLWKNLSNEIATITTQRTLRYLGDGPGFLAFTQELMAKNDIDIQDPMKLLDYCYAALTVYPQFTFVYLAKEDGSFYGAYRTEDEKSVIGTWRMIQAGANGGADWTEVKNYHLDGQGVWVLENTEKSSFDPRTRPYWADGVKHPSGGWSAPYLFATSQKEGFTYIKPYVEQDRVVRMWLIDYDITTISNFLAELKVGASGQVYIIADDGTIIASTKTTNENEGGQKLMNAANSKNEIIAESWKKIQTFNIASSTFQSASFEFGDYLAYIESFPNQSKLPWEVIPWNVLTIVPREEFFGPIKAQAWMAVTIALAFCLVFTLCAILFFGHISKRLKSIAFEMDSIGNLHFSSRLFAKESSIVREVNMMDTAIDRMKIGLSSFAKYVPVDLIQELIKSGHSATVGGKKVEVTILFSDLANFTSFAEQTPPDELVKTLGEYFTAMTNVIQENKGVVDKYIGDAIMALWGAPTPLPAHPLSACKAALAMQREFDKWSKGKIQEKGLRLRIGINTGSVIAGNIGSPERMDYTAIGDAVNLASRLESLNKFYGTRILLGEETARLVSSEMVVRPLDFVAVKGKSRPTVIYELMGELKGVNPALLKAVEAFKTALDLFRQRHFTEAVKKFLEAHDLFEGDDLPSKLLAERAQRYAKEPPPASWDGSLTMEQK